ncbi:hypothetical protein Hanom_Chr11g01017071 [Helianthus anomalus]
MTSFLSFSNPSSISLSTNFSSDGFTAACRPSPSLISPSRSHFTHSTTSARAVSHSHTSTNYFLNCITTYSTSAAAAPPKSEKSQTSSSAPVRSDSCVRLSVLLLMWN